MEPLDSLLRRVWFEGGPLLPLKQMFPWAVSPRETMFGSRKLIDAMAEKAWVHGLEPESYIVQCINEDVVVVYPPNWKGVAWTPWYDEKWRAMEEEMRRPPPLTQDELRDDPC